MKPVFEQLAWGGNNDHPLARNAVFSTPPLASFIVCLSLFDSIMTRDQGNAILTPVAPLTSLFTSPFAPVEGNTNPIDRRQSKDDAACGPRLSAFNNVPREFFSRIFPSPLAVENKEKRRGGKGWLRPRAEWR